mgnify:CR=1 FL=1
MLQGRFYFPPTSGKEPFYTNENIDELLLRRHIGKKMRKTGKYDFKSKKRTKNQDENFIIAFTNLLDNIFKQAK